jgi:hypothetical protein
MSIRKLATLAAVAAFLALGSSPASASTQLRLDPGSVLAGATTITNTSSGPATFSTGAGELICQNTTFDVDVGASPSGGTLGGSLTTLTFTNCTDSIPIVNLTSCHRHGAALPAVSINGSVGLMTFTDLIVRCNVSQSAFACYYTAESTGGTANNAASTLTFSNNAIWAITSPTTDAVAAGACGGGGIFNVTLRHIVQGGTNRTVTFLP